MSRELTQTERDQIIGQVVAACAILRGVRDQFIATKNYYEDADELYATAREFLRKVSNADG